MNQIKKPLIKTLMCAVIALSACGQITPRATTVPPPTNTATLPSTATLVPTPTATVDLLQEANIVEKCPTILPSTDLPEIKAGGVIVFLKNSEYIGIIRQAFLLNPANNRLFEFSQEGEILSYYDIAVSPDRKTLAYSVNTLKDETISLVLSNSMGERQKIIPIKSDVPYPMYGGIQNWLNDHQLILDRDVFNPYTGERQSYNPEDFPDFSSHDMYWGLLEYDPGVTRVTYRSFGVTTALADLVSKKILAELPGNSGHPEIAWRAEGDFLAVVEGTQNTMQGNVDDEIFLVDRDGKENRQLTHLSTYYGTKYGLHNLSWSPDGTYIAFWQDDYNPDRKGMRLFVLDTKTEELTSYCTWGEYRNLTTFYGPIWSPDGRQLLIGDLSIKDTVRAVVIDTENNTAIVIADDAIPVGWMTSE
ncbi:MAG: PD40 domain-containing protein [Chloroflexi bacterium]|nr:PD40 domain-containing protein [Chloroflexota bacterium]